MSEYTKAEEIFASIFKRAVDEDVVVPCPDKSTANTMRFRMYAFARKVKAMPRGQEELVNAIESVSLTIDATGLHARGKLKYVGMQAALEAMGGAEGVAKWLGKTPQDLEVEASQRRMAELLQGQGQGSGSGEGATTEDVEDLTVKPVAGKTNPYY